MKRERVSHKWLMKRWILLLMLFLIGCESQLTQQDNMPLDSQDKEYQEVPQNTSTTMNMHIGGISFLVTLYDGVAVHNIMNQLPMEIQMSDLHNNEKFYNMNQTFPTQPEQVKTIHAGDFMLFKNNCLVLFYKDFSTTYSYTRLGYVEDVNKLVEILPEGNVNIRFTK